MPRDSLTRNKRETLSTPFCKRVYRSSPVLHGPSTPPVYMTVYGPSVRTSSAVYMARTRSVHGTCTRPCTGRAHGRVHDTYTGRLYERLRPCTWRVHGPVHVSTCLRVQGPCTRPCTGHLHGRKRPSTRPYTCLLYTSPSPRDRTRSRMPSSA